ncbi:MAG: hypothetical protein DCF22_18220 [Leptolyngbya sp.]|nr:MAG: hypothetical protein DCF22_18220 [Leptolyngbya sp.]
MMVETTVNRPEPSLSDDFQVWRSQVWEPYWTEIQDEREWLVLDEDCWHGNQLKSGQCTKQGNFIRISNTHLHSFRNHSGQGKQFSINSHHLTSQDPADAEPLLVFMLEAMHKFDGDAYVLKQFPQIREELQQLRQWQEKATMVERIENYSLDHLLYARCSGFRHFIDTYMELSSYRNRIRGQIKTIAARNIPPLYGLQVK